MIDLSSLTAAQQDAVEDALPHVQRALARLNSAETELTAAQTSAQAIGVKLRNRLTMVGIPNTGPILQGVRQISPYRGPTGIGPVIGLLLDGEEPPAP